MAQHPGSGPTPATSLLLTCSLLLLLLLHAHVTLCQQDCTGVVCPPLSHCIQEVLEGGACCPTCARVGCTCEGYQYYDCANAGFQNGKVPAGDAYFVDYGSTECSCPRGGGRISCHYISCPELPAHCIETSQPADGCPQCERVGCEHDGQRHDAGHSFHMDACSVCHCPAAGGQLTCSPVPGCRPGDAPQPAAAPPPTQGGAPPRRGAGLRRGPGEELSPSPRHRPPPSGGLPLFRPPSMDRMPLEEDEGEEDYDYEPVGVPGSTDAAPSLPSPALLPRGADGAGARSQDQGPGRRNKLELRERYGVHEHGPARGVMDHGAPDPRVQGHGAPDPRVQGHGAPDPRVQGHGAPDRRFLDNGDVDHGVLDHRVLEHEAPPTGGPFRTPLQPHTTTHGAQARTRTSPGDHGKHPANSLLTPQAPGGGALPVESMADRAVFPLHRTPDGDNLPPFFQSHEERPAVLPEKDSEPLEGPWSGPPSFRPSPRNQSPWADPMESARRLSHGPGAGEDLDRNFRTQSTLRSPTTGTTDSPDLYDAYDEEEPDGEEEEGTDRHREMDEWEPTEALGEGEAGGRDLVHDGRRPGAEEPTDSLAADHLLHHETTGEPSTEPPTETMLAATTTTSTTTSSATTTTTTTTPATTTSPTTTSTTTTTNSPTTTSSATTTTTPVQPAPTRTLSPRAEDAAEEHHGRMMPQAAFDLPSEDVATAEEEEEGREADGEEREDLTEGPDASAGLMLRDCCAVGQRWASEHQRCTNMPLLSSDTHSVCSVAQQQCCLSSLKEGQCVSGLESARAGHGCHADSLDRCADDSYQVCCSCCSLGLKVRSEGLGCDGHRYLGYPCGNIFLTCCEAEGGTDQATLGRSERPMPSATPLEDSRFPQETFSVDQTGRAGGGAGASYGVQEQKEVVEDVCQLCQHICTPTGGSYRCSCLHGYTLQGDGHSCTPGTPVEDNRLMEEEEFGWRSPSTTSPRSSTTTPMYLNPCAGGGPCSQRCSVVGGRYSCSCFPGYALAPDRLSCDDLDECVSSVHSCGVGERCINTLGSHVCERQLSCSEGYQARHGVCEDIDECVVRTHNCGAGLVCKNTDGSFVCDPKQKCLTGFKLDSHGNCIDINECSALTESCSSGFKCINTVGSYTCQRHVIQCGQGYQSGPDGTRCIDVDECQMGTHRCGTGQICHNLPGSHRCDCGSGYQYDPIRKVCNDVNECWRYPGRLCSQTCENTPGSYQCSCTAGFALAFDGKNCEDLNECDTNPCSQECANIYGSYQCYCRQGFYLKEDGLTCEDIDECSQSMGNMCAFECVNVPGSYQCACPPEGYTVSANKHTCKDIDECTTGAHNCSGEQVCYNIQGGYRCLSFTCPPNYKKTADTRCERLGCPGNAAECPNLPLRITYYQLKFQTNIMTPAQIFRISPSPAYAGDHVSVVITRGNEEGYFSARKLNGVTGAVYLQRQVREAKDFLVDVEMRLLRQGVMSSFLARIYVFITASTL